MIKKDKNKNDYLLIPGGLWVRDFTKKHIQPLDINNLISETDASLMLENEIKNSKGMYQKIETEEFTHEKVLIVGSGNDLVSNKHLLDRIPGDVTIIGVNDILKYWDINKRLDYFVVNNPYNECLFYLDKAKTLTKCIASCRSDNRFMSTYVSGLIYTYTPVSDKNYICLEKEANWLIDDYRNPVCAAIGLAYKFSCKRILLFASDDFYKEYRPSAEKVSENTWMYSQQKQAHNLIDGNLYWLRKSGIKTGYFPKRLEYKNANYISEKDLSDFFIS